MILLLIETDEESMQKKEQILLCISFCPTETQIIHQSEPVLVQNLLSSSHDGHQGLLQRLVCRKVNSAVRSAAASCNLKHPLGIDFLT